jgi:hypothetical protein
MERLQMNYRPAQAKQIIGCGTTKLYQLINSGDLEAVKLGGMTIITQAAIDKLIANAPAARPAKAA